MNGKELFFLRRLEPIALLIFVTSMSGALSSSVWSVYINSLVNSEAYVGFITSGLSAASLFAYIFLIPYLERHRKVGLYFLTLLATAGIFISYGIIQNLFIFIAVATVATLIGAASAISRGEVLRNQTTAKNLGKAESFFYSIGNSSWLIAALLAGYIADLFGIKYVFYLSAGFCLIGAVVMKLIHLKETHLPKKVHVNPIQNIRDFLKKKKLVEAYVLGIGIDFWWGFIYTFVPLFIMEEAGLGVEWVGYFLAAVVIPLMLLEYFFGRISDKKGCRVLFLTGYAGLAIAAFLCFWFTNIYAILAIIVLSSVCAAMVEPTSESYFLKHTPVKNMDKYYAIYHTAVPLGYFISRAVGAVILLFLPWNYIFLGFAAIMGSFSFMAYLFRRDE